MNLIAQLNVNVTLKDIAVQLKSIKCFIYT